jgi:hypothetical protein
LAARLEPIIIAAFAHGGMTEMADYRGKEFQIGLAMSGAVSAGAYTAGVFDFLIQALDEWEKARSGPDADKIPNHRVGIKVMSGASAGAITAAIGAIALADADQKPVEFDTHCEGEQKIKCYLPKLYETWVVKPGLVAEGDEKFDFLQTSDLAPPPKDASDFSRTRGIPYGDGEPQPVTSLLNSRLLDSSACDALDVKRVTNSPRPYISTTLHIYMTLSNLRGVPYSVPFDSGADLEKSGIGGKGQRENCYHMISHGDRVHYAVTGLGTWNSKNSKSAFADQDQKRTIEAQWLVTPSSDPRAPNWKDYAVCALASAAFPIGLAPRMIGATLGTDSKPGEYHGRWLPVDMLPSDLTTPPAWLPNVLNEDPFWFTAADGGIIDNDPFEYARFSLKNRALPGDSGTLEASATLILEDHLPSALDEVDRAVIMISPFPELNPIAPEGQPAADIVSILSALLPALIDQARFKPSEVILAADPKHGSRYLIGPSRVTSDGKEQRYGIASGLLSGFGGFVARTFRDHDYQLGRRNCQRFLRTTFALPADNDIIKCWQASVDKTEFKAIQTDADKRRNSPETYCIIPLLGTAKAEVALPEWPRISQARFDALQTRIAERFDAVAPRLLAQNVTGLLWFLLSFAVRPFPRGIGLIRGKVLNFVKAYIQADLVRRDMIEGWDLPPSPVDGDDVRLVLAELINPSFDLRNISGLCKAVGLDRPTVQAALALGQSPAAAGESFEVWEAPWKDNLGNSLYTLASRKRSVGSRISNLVAATRRTAEYLWKRERVADSHLGHVATELRRRRSADFAAGNGEKSASLGPTRNLNAWIDDPCPRAGKLFRVSINIGVPYDSAAASVPLVELDWHGVDFIDLGIAVSSIDCDVMPWWRELRLPRTGDSETIVFKVTTDVAGTHEFSIRVFLLKQMIQLQSLMFTVTVAAAQVELAGGQT